MTARPASLPIALLAAATAVGCGAPSSTADPAVLVLGGHEVRRSEFEAHLRKVESRGGEPLEPSVRQALLEPFLEERLLVLEARRRGLLAAGAGEADEQAAVKRLLESEVRSRVNVTDGDVAGYYARHSGEFQRPERRSLRQILVGTENEARDLRRRLQREPRSFELLARSRSRGPEAAQGGLMGTFAPGELPADLEAAAFALEPGAMSPVVRTPLGYHVLRVETREPAREVPLEECREEIRQRLWERRAEEGAREFVRALLARAKVNHEAAFPVGPAG